MSKPRCVFGKGRVLKGSLVLASGVLVFSTLQAQATEVGHSRLVSAPGQPLVITVQVNDLSPGDADTLAVSLPPAEQWAQAGLRPPVPLQSLGARIQKGYAKGSRIIEIRSGQAFSSPVVDLLIDISSASGKTRHQVSLLAQGAPDAVTPPVATTAAVANNGPEPVLSSIRVSKGDTLFGLARSNAVAGVSVYQLMVGLYQANPQAFIQKNLNLVKAGASLSVPDRATLTAISDREARRIFQQHAKAFALYRQRLAATPNVAEAGAANASSGVVQAHSGSPNRDTADQAGDRLRLSGAASSALSASSPGSGSSVQGSGGVQQNGSAGGQAGASDDAVAMGKALGDAGNRVAQLEQNVQQLNQALQSQSPRQGQADAASSSAQRAAPQAGSNTVDSAESAASVSGNTPASGQASGISAADAGQKGAPTGNVSATGAASSGSSNAATTRGGASAVDASSAGSGSGAAGNAGTAAASPSVSGGASVGQADPNVSATGGAAGAGNSGNSSGANGKVTNGAAGVDQLAQSVAEPVTQKAEQTVSWLQENMLGVVGALLTLVVLVVAWLLRRGGGRSSSAHESAEGAITEAMIKDKLESIDLSLDTSVNDSDSKR